MVRVQIAPAFVLHAFEIESAAVIDKDKIPQKHALSKLYGEVKPVMLDWPTGISKDWDKGEEAHAAAMKVQDASKEYRDFCMAEGRALEADAVEKMLQKWM